MAWVCFSTVCTYIIFVIVARCRYLFSISITAAAGICFLACFRTSWFFGNYTIVIAVLMVIRIFFTTICTLSVCKMMSLCGYHFRIAVATFTGISFFSCLCTGWFFGDCFCIAVFVIRIFFMTVSTFTIFKVVTLCWYFFHSRR